MYIYDTKWHPADDGTLRKCSLSSVLFCYNGDSEGDGDGDGELFVSLHPFIMTWVEPMRFQPSICKQAFISPCVGHLWSSLFVGLTEKDLIYAPVLWAIALRFEALQPNRLDTFNA